LLLDVAKSISGPERALIYLVACETGLRANELRLLRVNDVNFDGMTLTVRPDVSKNDRGAVMPLKPSTANLIREHTRQKMPSSRIFSVPLQPHLMIKADLARAGIEYKTDEGTAYFHSLRHVYATALPWAAGNVKTAQSLMRHSDPRLTLNVYTHGVPEQERAAIEALPNLYLPDVQGKTGTDDRPIDRVSSDDEIRPAICSATCFATLLPNNCNKQQSTARIGETKNRTDGRKAAILAKKPTSPAGFEPATSGFGGQRSIQLGYGDNVLY